MDNMVTKEERVNQLRTKINSRLYKDNEPKLKRANKIFYITYLLMQLGMLGNIVFLIFEYGGTPLIYTGTVWSIAGMVVCTVFYLRDQANPNMSNICILQFVVTYFIAVIINGNDCMMFFPIPLLVALMTYMKRKKMYIAAAGIAIAALLRYIGIMAGVIAQMLNQKYGHLMATGELIVGFLCAVIYLAAVSGTWTLANADWGKYNRYHAVYTSNKMINVFATIFNAAGYYSGKNWRR